MATSTHFIQGDIRVSLGQNNGVEKLDFEWSANGDGDQYSAKRPACNASSHKRAALIGQHHEEAQLSPPAARVF
ncbi:hypothetical protein FIBSPDRAFT_878522 [Athelia psychrophila]|uniref:Uncharacterized protein n=1 Tax=Athelia psychrophila TaxID=1759441 RepID=A0A167UYQ7_9AGAM|nr:hypothetical protein FIBSPDRAFT_878510 [Fibularhizoctonia sp. CBS 109695]KZP04449.1 hypothetical protein FIBSPDRAFT_878522 [Fibularhizoctonia sp. CBS 109695]